MKNKLLKLFSSNIKIRVSGKNTNNFIKRLIRNKINIIKIIPISYKEIDLIIDYNDLEEVLKYRTIYDIKIKRYYGKLKLLKLIKKNIFILFFSVVGILIIYILSNIIFNVEVIHSNNNLIKSITEELEYYGIKKYSFVKSYDKIEEIENKILENNKDKIEWLEIIREGTKYIVRVEERIIDKKIEDGKVYNIVSSKNAVIKEIQAESGEKVRSTNTYIKRGDIVISSEITLPSNEKKIDSASGKVLGEVWYNVSIEFPLHYHEVKYTGNKRKVLVYNFINKRIPFFNFNEYKTFDKDIKYIYSNIISPDSLYFEYQYETIVIDKNYTQEKAKEIAIKKAKDKLKEKYQNIEEIIEVIITNETSSKRKISLNLFIKALEDITLYQEVIPDNLEKSE